MTDEGIFATTDEVMRKVGINASSVSNTELYINQYMTEAESHINETCRFNFSDNYATLNVDVKNGLKMAASCLAAMDVLNYDTDAIGTSAIILRYNMLWAKYTLAIKELKKKEVKTFINQA